MFKSINSTPSIKSSLIRRSLQALTLAVFCGGAVLSSVALPTEVAEARAGGGRSVGRSPSPSRRPSPAPSYNSQPQIPREAARSANPYMPPQSEPQRSGGFLRNAAGGLAGGFLGSMLFNSIGRSNTYGGGGYGGGGGGGGGGIGFFEILIFAGIAYFGYRWWRSRQSDAAASGGRGDNLVNFRMPQEASSPGLAPAAFVAPISSDEASDLFFRIQGAWTRRDLSSVQDILGSEVAADLNRDLAELKAQHRINRLENISVRHVEVGEAWTEGGLDQVVVRFTANLLDYTVDEASNKVLEGSDSQPVKFDEEWTFARPSGGGRWQLLGIQQVN